MRYMSHIRASLFSIITLISSNASAFGEITSAASRSAPLSIALASSEQEIQSSIEQGMQSLLLGDILAARQHFALALKHDEKHALALCGLLMCGLDAASFNRYAQALQQLDEHYIPTPQEGRYLEGLYLIIAKQPVQARDHFERLALRYRADLVCRLWAALLYQDGYDALHKPREGQARALALLDESLDAQGTHQHALLHYLRAYLEADAPSPSPRALASAQYAAEHLAQEPMAQLLAAHMLKRSSQGKGSAQQDSAAITQAITLLARAEQGYLAEQGEQLYGDDERSFFWLRLRLYRIALLMSEQPKEALRLYNQVAELMKGTLSKPMTQAVSANAQPSGRDLLLWEWSLIPLRQLILSRKLDNKISIESFTHKPMHYTLCRLHPQHRDIITCIKNTLLARYNINHGQASLAHQQLAEAQQLYDELIKQRELDAQLVGNPIYARALDTCNIAICHAQIELYKESAEMWRDKLKELDLRASMLLPPLETG